ncbi:retrovirus-related pol polyprotein from transposon TNT 1-94 [Tanacetum coccineum]
MHNNIMAAGSRDRPPMLAMGRYAQWQSRFMRYVDTKPNSNYKEIHLIFTGIGDDIYSTVDACTTAKDMSIAIERFYKMMDEMMRNQLEVATMQVNVQFLQQLQPEWHENLTNHMHHHQNNHLLPGHATTRHKGKEIAKPITPPSKLASEEDSDPEQAQRDKDMQINLALIAKYFKKIYQPTNNNLITSSNTRNKNVDTYLRYKNENQTGQFGNQRTVTVTRARETVGNQVVQQTGIQCFNCKEFGHFAKEYKKTKQVQSDAEYNVFSNERKHSEQPKFINDTYVAEKDDSNVIPDSSNICDNDNQADQNAEECDDERVVLANLIENLKLDTDENKKIQKQLKKSNTSLAHELQECKSALEKCKSSLDESNRTRDRYLGALYDQEVELAKYKRFNDCTLENERLERKLKETQGLLTQK